MKTAVLLFCLIPAAMAIRCYDYMSSNNQKNDIKTWLDCPYQTNFCFKRHTASRDYNGNVQSLQSRSCGSSAICVKDGCTGNDYEKDCCCSKDLCNTSTVMTIVPAFFVLITVYMLRL